MLLLLLIVPAALLLLAVAIRAALLEWRASQFARQLARQAEVQAIWDRRIRSLELYRQQREGKQVYIGPPEGAA